MAIRMRRGLESELDISKAVPGEWLISTDTKKIRMCVQPGIVKEIASVEEVADVIKNGIESIQEAEKQALSNISDGVDETLSVEGKAAEAKVTGEKISQLSSEIDINTDKIVDTFRNGTFFYPLIWEKGTVIANTGNVGVENAHIRTKDFVPINSNAEVYIDFIGTSGLYYVCGYDAGKKYLGYQGVYKHSHEAQKINPDYRYIKIVTAMFDSSYDITTDFGENISMFENTLVMENQKNIEYCLKYKSPTADFRTECENLLSNVTEPCMFNAVKGLWNDLPEEVRQGVFVNLSGNGIKGEACLQIIYSYQSEYSYKCYQRVVEKNSSTITNWVCFGGMKNLESLYTSNKKCGCLGDSITYGNGGTSWVTKLKEFCGFSEVINYGVSGSAIKSNGNNGFIDRYVNMKENLDYIIVWGGVNDFMWTTQTKEQFKTNFETLINGIINKYPSSKILGITPMKFEYNGSDANSLNSNKWDKARSDGIVLKDYRDMEIEVFEKYSIPYLDFFNNGGISCENEAQANTYFASEADHLHPNTDGNLLIIAPKIAEALKRI